MNPLDLPIDRFCNLVYFWAVRNMKDDARADFDRHISQPIASAGAEGIREATGVWSRESELAQFSR